MESKYAALSNAMKTLIPIRNLVDKMWKFLDLQENGEEHHLPSTIQTTVFEDNNACLILATTQ